MTDFNIFYDTNKNIKWCSSGPVDSAVISGQADIGLSHIKLDLDQIPDCDNWYVNSSEDGVVEYGKFSLSFSATTIALEETITITGVPAGTEIFMNQNSWPTYVSQGTYSSGTLTLTGTMAGSFRLKFVKDKYHDTHQMITVTRQQ